MPKYKEPSKDFESKGVKSGPKMEADVNRIKDKYKKKPRRMKGMTISAANAKDVANTLRSR